MNAALSRKDKQVLLDFDNSVREFGKQFTEQQRLLDLRTENKILLVNDLQEFFKRRSELDFEYGKNLDRLCERFSERFQKQRANYGLPKKDRASFANLWSKLIIDAKFKAKAANTLSDIYSKNICTRLTEIGEDIQRISRNVKDTQHTLQQEISNQIQQLQNRRHRFVDSKLKAMRSRNEYILTVDAVSAVLSKYYNHDLSELVTKFDHNFHNSFSSTLQAFIGAEIRMANTQIQSANSLAHTVSVMDPQNDNKMFLEDNHQTFLPFIKLSFVPHAEDEVRTITAEENIEKELKLEHRKLFDTLKSLQVELSDLQISMEKRKKGLEATYKKYDSEMNGFYHIDMTPVSGPTTSPNSTLVSSPPQQLKVDKEEWETGLLTKFKEHIMMQSTHIRAQAKYDVLTKAIGEITSDLSRSMNSSNGRKRTVKLFGTSLKSQLDDTGQEIPEIVESCVKYIAKYGLKHQGIFRVPGASQEIADMKKAFEECRDPLSGLNHWKDINAVAGVFRVYFREMAEPLFPYELNQDYLRASCITRTDEQIAENKTILQKIPAWNLHVIKYMLKFLNLIAQYSDQNKMTSHNLAVVFGPTLFRVPDNDNLLTNQGQINVFVDTLISEFYKIFPDEPMESNYEDKTDGLSDEGDEGERTEDEIDSEDENETVEAIALHNYTARTQKEVSFNKGDILTIFSRTNSDWWDARVNGRFGFAPVPYIKILDRPMSVSESSSEQRRSRDVADATQGSDESKLRKSSEPETPPPSPRPADSKEEFKLKSASVSDMSTSEHVGNVFAAIDPTVNTTASPATVRRSGSDRTGACGVRKNIPNRSLSDKSMGGSRKYQTRNPTLPLNEDAETTNEQSTTAPSPISTFSATKQPLLPPLPAGGAAKLLHHVSQPDIHNASKHSLIGEKVEASTEMTSFGRGGSVKDKSKMFHAPIKERPMSALARPLQGQIQIESPNKPDHIPSFKPPPPPTASKPKPAVKKKEAVDLAATLHAAAAAKKQTETKDITHL
ncbi:SLIT-ROBO Rho GTPase-activating protein 2-like isoform X2 [Hydractinia symbiolongicarpus]|uniref:SLIT-ROBO Rho GTPase-activating protein 2-like isoform X2 n=1 Tax=Hydractinia symbiolongicarpus TaxID=13093 RepID=UPI00254DA946|nr:SLIT-ROBO Rho GTPase-activating protein 2-like isoform X2 [Hydractinia symbiolongicarpus]